MLFSLVVVLVPAPPSADSSVSLQLDKLTRMSTPDAETYLLRHPQVALQLFNGEPDLIAAKWKSYSPAERRELIGIAPQIVGNLEGADYLSRDAANRKELVRRLAAATSAVSRDPKNTIAKRTVTCLEAIHATVRGSHQPRRYLVSLTGDAMPLAAVAVGDLETARQATFDVPGMGTYTDDIQLWTQAAVNVFDAQGEVGASEHRAVVAWIGYQTPPPGIDATFGDYAARGAPKLGSAIRGLYAARGGTERTSVSIIAHSYGTTMAADALAAQNLHIFSFVMFGSAGIEDRIKNAAALHAKHVYTGEAGSDDVAIWGRVSRQDPSAPEFGATVIPVNGGRNTGFLPVTGHVPILHSAWNDDPYSSAWSGYKTFPSFHKAFEQHFAEYGYLDAGTQSLETAAKVTTPGTTRALASR